MELIVSSFYKYVNLDPETFQKEHQEFCNSLGIKGKVLVAKEGINGTISGTKEQIDQYESKLRSYKELSNITFKRNGSPIPPFKKMMVKVRNEIITSRFNVNTDKVGKHMSPKELHELYEKNADFIIIDARNNYESKIGKFKNAMTPNIAIFRDFTKVIPQMKECKDKKIVLYCTGGVRCEKASALLMKKGFKDVNQLDDGILNYIEQYPDAYFEGRCFVFDDRLSIPSGVKDSVITLCEKCNVPCGEYINCANMKCDKLTIYCPDCNKKMESACSKRCMNIVRKIAQAIETK